MRFERAVVVDDEPASRAVMRHVLEAVGLTVGVADSGERGLELVLSDDVDVVVTDIRMPGIGGVEMATRLLEARGEDCPSMIAVTRHPEDVPKPGPFDLVLRKPVSPARLHRWLRENGNSGRGEP